MNKVSVRHVIVVGKAENDFETDVPDFPQTVAAVFIDGEAAARIRTAITRRLDDFRALNLPRPLQGRPAH